MKITPSEIRKAIACACAIAAGAVAQGLLVGAAATWVTVVTGVFATYGVWLVKND